MARNENSVLIKCTNDFNAFFAERNFEAFSMLG